MSEQVHLIRASDVGGLPVVTIDGGEDAAEIKDIIYDATRHHLIGFTLNKRGWFRGSLKAALDVGNVVGIGSGAVMVLSDDVLTESAEAIDAIDSASDAVDVIGDSVVSSSGSVIGEVIDVVIETAATPRAVGYEVSTDNGTVFIPSSAQMSISGDNLMVPAEAEEFTSNDLVGFGGAVASFRDLLANGEQK